MTKPATANREEGVPGQAKSHPVPIAAGLPKVHPNDSANRPEEMGRDWDGKHAAWRRWRAKGLLRGEPGTRGATGPHPREEICPLVA